MRTFERRQFFSLAAIFSVQISDAVLTLKTTRQGCEPGLRCDSVSQFRHTHFAPLDLKRKSRQAKMNSDKYAFELEEHNPYRVHHKHDDFIVYPFDDFLDSDDEDWDYWDSICPVNRHSPWRNFVEFKRPSAQKQQMDKILEWRQPAGPPENRQTTDRAPKQQKPPIAAAICTFNLVDIDCMIIFC